MSWPRGVLVGRDRESALLRAAWEASQRGEPQLVVLTGQRRVGKTFLLQHVAKDLEGARVVHHQATQAAEPQALRYFHEDLVEALGEEALDVAPVPPADWRAALRLLAGLGRREPLLAIIDEVPYLESASRGFASIVQQVWDREQQGDRASHLLLVLAGSAVAMMEELLGPSGALHRRATHELRLEPFGVEAVAAAFPELPAEVVLQLFAATGGWPLHLQQWRPEETVRENLARLAGEPGGILLGTGERLLRELPARGGHRQVLEAIGAGATRRSRIADLAGQRVDLPLETLRRGGFVRRSTPVGAVRRTPPLYELADPHLRFWFFVLGHLVERIQGGEGEAVLERQWPRWQQHVGWTFEEVARAHARRLVTAGSLPLDTLIGRWWSTTGVEAEIDVVGMQGGRTALLGEARWSRRGFDQRDVARLEELSARLPDARDALFGFWSRGDVPRPRGDRAIRRFGVEEALGRPGAALAG